MGNVLPEQWLKRAPHQVHVLPESLYLQDREKLQPAGDLSVELALKTGGAMWPCVTVGWCSPPTLSQALNQVRPSEPWGFLTGFSAFCALPQNAVESGPQAVQ